MNPNANRMLGPALELARILVTYTVVYCVKYLIRSQVKYPGRVARSRGGTWDAAWMAPVGLRCGGRQLQLETEGNYAR